MGGGARGGISLVARTWVLTIRHMMWLLFSVSSSCWRESRSTTLWRRCCEDMSNDFRDAALGGRRVRPMVELRSISCIVCIISGCCAYDTLSQ